MFLSALFSKGGLKDTVVEALPEEFHDEFSKYQGRVYSHWSKHLLIIGAIGGLGIAVSAYMVGNYAALAFGSALLITNATGAFYLHQFIPLKALEGYVYDLTLRIQKLSSEVIDLSEANNVLRQQQIDFEEVGSKYADSIDDAQKVMEAKFLELSSIVENLKQTQIKLTMLFTSLKNGAKVVQNRLTEQLNENSQQINQINLIKNSVNHSVERMGQNEKKFSAKTDELSKKNNYLEGLLSYFNKLIGDFSARTEKMEGLLKQIQDEKEKLQKKIQQKKAIDEKLRLAEKKLNKMLMEIKQAKIEFGEYYQILKDFQKLTKLLPLLKPYLEQNKTRNNAILSD